MGFTDTEERLLKKYINEVQPIYAEYEVMGGKVPADAEMRVAEFLTAMSQARFGGERANGGERYKEAEELLDSALFHCKKGLCAMYMELADERISEIDKHLVNDINDGKFSKEITRLRGLAVLRIDDYKERRAQVCRTYVDLESLEKRDLERRLSFDSELCNDVFSMYDAAHDYYEKADKGLSEAAFLMDRDFPLRSLSAVEARVSIALIVVGILGLMIFAARGLYGV